MKDLTKGKPSRLILAFAIPIFMANILQLTYSIVDTRIVGSYLGENSLAAVGATTTLSNLMIGFLMGLANGFAIITAQKFGARDYDGVKKSFALSIKMGCIIALAITVLCLVIFASDSWIFKCVKGFDGNGCVIYFYYNSRACSDIFV